MATENLIQRLNKNRKKNLPHFERIKLTPEAVNAASKLFLHPFCVNLRDLRTFIGKNPVKLSVLSQYIITAFPNTIAFYSEEHKKILLDYQDILDCFACDHQMAIAGNKIEKIHSPAYALAHILTVCKVTNLKTTGQNTLADLDFRLRTKKITFRNVFVPKALKVKKNQNVFHHFGVIIDSASNRKLELLSEKIENKQKKLEYLNKIIKENIKTIDFGKPGLYNFDLLDKIITESKAPGKTNLEKSFKLKLDQNQKVPFSK